MLAGPGTGTGTGTGTGAEMTSNGSAVYVITGLFLVMAAVNVITVLFLVTRIKKQSQVETYRHYKVEQSLQLV